MDRHVRQLRLSGVGAEGQARIARADVGIPGSGIAAHVAARYLAGAGVAVVRVRDEAVAASARAVDPTLRVEVDPCLPEADPEGPALVADPSARAVAGGALFALAALRAVLLPERS